MTYPSGYGESGVHADGAGQERVEYRLRERERFLRTLISNFPGILYRCRAKEEWTLEFISDGVELKTLLGDSDFLKSRRVTWDDMTHPEDRERVSTEVRHLAATRVPFSTTAHWVSYRVIPAATKQIKYVRDRFRFVDDDSGHLVALEGVITHVTELALADARVRQSERRYRLLAEHTNDLVCLHALDGNFLFLSPSCERVLGVVSTDLVGTSSYPLIHPDDVSAIRDGVFGRLVAGEPTVRSEHLAGLATNRRWQRLPPTEETR
jgi:PAS domain S-box-containing protein